MVGGWCSIQRKGDGRSHSQEEMWVDLRDWWETNLNMVIRYMDYFAQCSDKYLTLRKKGLILPYSLRRQCPLWRGRHGRTLRQLLTLHLQPGSRWWTGSRDLQNLKAHPKWHTSSSKAPPTKVQPHIQNQQMTKCSKQNYGRYFTSKTQHSTLWFP